jgi:hypothetical protein
LEINGLITVFVIKEKADPFDKMIGEGKLEVGNAVTLRPMEGRVS